MARRQSTEWCSWSAALLSQPIVSELAHNVLPLLYATCRHRARPQGPNLYSSDGSKQCRLGSDSLCRFTYGTVAIPVSSAHTGLRAMPHLIHSYNALQCRAALDQQQHIPNHCMYFSDH